MTTNVDLASMPEDYENYRAPSRLQRWKHSLFRRSPLTNVQLVLSQLADHAFDRRHGLDTTCWAEPDDLNLAGDHAPNGKMYQATRVFPFRSLMKNLAGGISDKSVFLDLGSGKGRTLLMASDAGFGTVRGVEFARELCKNAEKNCLRYLGKNTPGKNWEIHHSDAADYRFSGDESHVFLYNPFDSLVMAKVIFNLEKSLRKNPRNLVLIYHNPVEERIIKNSAIFSSARTLTCWGHRFDLYETRVSS